MREEEEKSEPLYHHKTRFLNVRGIVIPVFLLVSSGTQTAAIFWKIQIEIERERERE